MDSEEKIIVAFIFKRSGKMELKASDIYLPLSLELGWFSSQQSQNFVESAVQNKLLIQKKDKITPAFDVDTIEIPTGFRPTKQDYRPLKEIKLDVAESTDKKENIVLTIIDRIGTKTGQQKTKIEGQIQRIQEEKNIYPEIAALYIARQHNIDITDLLERVEYIVFKENTE